MNPSLRQLRTFVAVAELRHFGRAAQRLGLPQPTVSRHVRDLEDVLGTPLLERTSRSTSLTAAGVVALEHAQAVIARTERLVQAVDDAARRSRGELTVAFIASTINPFLTPLIQRLATDHPEVEVNVTQIRMREVVDQLRQGRVDLAVARDPRSDTELVQRTLASEPVRYAIPSAHPLARRRSIATADLDDEPLIMLDPRIWPPGHAAQLARLDEYGVTPASVRHAGSHAAAIGLVAAGAGLYQLPASAVTSRPDVTYLDLDDAASRIVTLRLPGTPSPALQAVLDTLESIANEG